MRSFVHTRIIILCRQTFFFPWFVGGSADSEMEIVKQKLERADKLEVRMKELQQELSRVMKRTHAHSRTYTHTDTHYFSLSLSHTHTRSHTRLHSHFTLCLVWLF